MSLAISTATPIRLSVLAGAALLYVRDGDTCSRNLPVSKPKQPNPERSCCAAQFLIECGEWKTQAFGKFEIGSVIQRETKPLCQLQGSRPRMQICFEIDSHHEGA